MENALTLVVVFAIGLFAGAMLMLIGTFAGWRASNNQSPIPVPTFKPKLTEPKAEEESPQSFPFIGDASDAQ